MEELKRLKREQLEAKEDALQHIYKMFNRYESSPPILYYAYFEDMPMGHEVKIAPDIYSTVIYRDELSMIVRTEFQKQGAILKNHCHDCREDIYVLSGRFRDNETGKVYTAKEGVIYNPYTTHELLCLEVGVMDVKFWKP